MSNDSSPRRSPSCRVCGAPVDMTQRFCGECGAVIAIDAAPDIDEAVPVADPLQGRTLADRYRIVRCIGRGGMGVVYEVEHVHIGKRLAMKLLHGELAGDAATVRRLRREAEAASRLSDSGTVQVFDFGQSDGLAYLVMELVEGEDMSVVLKRDGRMEFARVARLMLDVCSSLAEAHDIGLVHRDLKPENVMVVKSTSGERAKVLDFGLAVLRAQASSQSVSRPNAIVGTPHYMAPEQIRGETVDGRADIYSLGALMYRAITGVPPLTGETAIVVLTKHLSVDPVPPSTRVSSIDPIVDSILMKCLSKQPASRYASVRELAEDLTDWLASQGLEARRRTDATGSLQLRGIEAIATRRDIDAYEQALRRRSALTTVFLGALALSALAAVAYGVFSAASPPANPTREIEPNQEPEQATTLGRGVAMRGHLGKRIDRARGDVDVYRIARASSRPGAIRASVTALPNVDVVLELYKAGVKDPILRVDDSHGPGFGESFIGFPVEAGEHLLVVREHWHNGSYPTENVSDAYVVRWDEVEGVEATLDDSIERARQVEAGAVVRSTLGWATDVDVLCADGPIDHGRWTATPDANLDLVLALVDHAGVHGSEVDVGGPGAPETVTLDVPAGARGCLRIARKPITTEGYDPATAPSPSFGALLMRP